MWTEDKTEAAMPENPESRGNEPEGEQAKRWEEAVLEKQRKGDCEARVK